jgi:serine/threonine protein phosphatase PrpC
MKTPNTHH